MKQGEIMSNYYEKNASKYIEDTINCDMSEQYKFFLNHMSKKGKILDIGFGSGRDMRYFNSLGYEVEGIDPTINFINNIKDEFNVYHMSVEDMKFKSEYDGIWACASLLHVKRDNLKEALINCYNALKEDGIMYASFKYGNKEVINERYFNYVNEDILLPILNEIGYEILDKCITHDVRKEREEELWINIIFKK